MEQFDQLLAIAGGELDDATLVHIYEIVPIPVFLVLLKKINALPLHSDG
jgi:hypothetical protein